MKKLSFLVILLSIYWNSQAQNEKSWNITVAPYLYAPYTSGYIIIAGQEEIILSSPSDVLSNLEMAGMLHFEAADPKWSVSADFLCLKLGGDFSIPVPPAPAPIETDLKATTMLLVFYGIKRAVKWFEIGVMIVTSQNLKRAFALNNHIEH